MGSDWDDPAPHIRDQNADRKCVLEGECRPRHSSSKSTRIWCKGRVGMAHEFAWRPTTYGTFAQRVYPPRRPDPLIHETLTCSECGKQTGWPRYRCRDCWTCLPYRDRFDSGCRLITHGDHCDFRDYRFSFGYSTLYTLARLIQLSSEYPRSDYYARMLHEAAALVAEERRLFHR